METADGAIPLLVGVTGHRDVAQSHIDAARELVTQRLCQLVRDYPHTPVVVLSPLAEGADRIVAEAALALDLEVIVPLPVSLEEYRNDFTTPDSLAAFDELLLRAKASFVVPHASSSAEHRNERYAELGAFIAKTSDLLIALWDGLPARGAGGTGDVVDVRIANTEPIDWIIVSRNGSANAEQRISGSHHMPQPETWSRVDEFNRDAIADFPDTPRPSLFTIADELAMRFHAEQNRALDCTFAFIAAAVIALEGYALDATLGGTGIPPIVFLIANLFCFAAAFFVVAYARVKRFESKSQDYRALSEALRIQRFWDELDLGGDLGTLYERKHEIELEWVRKALRSSTKYEGWRMPGRVNDQHWIERARAACKSWIDDQERFFDRARLRDEAKVKRTRLASGALIVVASILTLTLVVYELSRPEGHEFRDVAIFLISVFAASSALIHGYADRSAWSYHSREYARMWELYRSAGRELTAMLDGEAVQPEAARALFRSIAREALSENADWLLAHRERPIELPDT